MFDFRPILMGLLACMALASCSANRGPRADIPYATNEAPLLSQATINELSQSAYYLGPNDELDISVFQVPDLSREYRINDQGFIDLPLLGAVEAAGFTELQLARSLEAKYGRRFLQNPSIQVQATTQRIAKITVEGAVKRPGSFKLDGPTTLLEAIALANGIELGVANQKRVLIIRETDGEIYRAAFDLRQVREGLMPNPNMVGGDIIVVEGSNLRQDLLLLFRSIPVFAVFFR